jgi:hypothetical protein
MTNQYAKSLKTRKKKDEVTKDDGLTFSGEVNFSDTGNGNDADFNAPERAETALFTIKRLVARSQSGVQDSIKKFILQRQSTIAANKKKKEEAEKLRRNGWQST